jgi:hypothetical protein
MNPASSPARNYRRLGYGAIAHAVAVLGLALFFGSGHTYESDLWFLRLWIGLVTLWFLWPVVLTFHCGRSVRRFVVFVSIATVLLLPSLRFCSMIAPWALGFPEGVTLDPLTNWRYFSAYRAGRAEAQKEVAAGILAMETFGFGAGGPAVKILREREAHATVNLRFGYLIVTCGVTKDLFVDHAIRRRS